MKVNGINSYSPINFQSQDRQSESANTQTSAPKFDKKKILYAGLGTLAACGAVALALGFALHFSAVRFYILLLTIVMVISAEMMNSAIEFALDSIYHNRYSRMVGMAKDIAAGAVMVVTIIALMIGALLFVPPIYTIFLG